MEALFASLAAKYGFEYAAKVLGLDQQTQNPKYAISIGGLEFDPVNAIKRTALSRGIESLFSGKLSGIMGPAALIGGAFMLGRAFDPTRPGSRNYNPNLAGQIADLNRRGMLNSRGQITSGPLKGKNLVSMFGTNDYGQMLQDKVDYYEDRITKGKSYSAKGYKEAKDAAISDVPGYSGVSIDGVTMHGADYQGGTGTDSTDDDSGESGFGGFCFDPNTLVQMADGSEKKIKDIQLGDNTKGGEVTGVFQFKASDEIHDYKGVTVAGSHYVKEDGKFIMVKDSPLSVKIDKIPVVYSLDTTDRRIFIKDIEFADYNGDGVAKGFLANAGINVPEFNKEVLRQVAERLI
jgi:hypothetical protein